MRLCVRSSVSRSPGLTSQGVPSAPGLSAPGLALPGVPAPGLAVPPDGLEDIRSPAVVRPHRGPGAFEPGLAQRVDLPDQQVEDAVAGEIGVDDRAGVPAEL